MTSKKIPLWRVIKAGMHINNTAIPVLFVLIQVVAIMHGVMQAVTTFATQRFYESVSDALSGGGSSAAVPALLTMGGLFLLRELLNGFHNFLTETSFLKGLGAAKRLTHEKMARLDPVVLEDTATHDMLDKVEESLNNVLSIIYVGVTILTFYVPYFAAMAIYLQSVNRTLIWAMLIAFVPTLFGQFMRSGIVAKFEDSAAPLRREAAFYDSAVTGREFFKETRILGGYRLMLERLQDAWMRLSSAEWRKSVRENLLELATGVVTALGWGAILYLLVSSLLSGAISVAAFAAVFGSVSLLFGIMREAFGHVGRIAENFGKGQNYVRFLDLPERGGKRVACDNDSGIRLENVSFTYPNAERPSVDGVTLEIRPGETIAIVGENGAGKSTLVRLMIGLFTPSSGTVTIRGMDTATADSVSLFGGVSGVFQKFQRYQLTLGENVEISGGERTATTASATLASVGVDVSDTATFPDALETMLSREFDGVDLSGGQWQRVAIARGLYRAHDLVVLDEPTAAIDPLEESRIYRMFADISSTKTAVIVTHRLGSTKFADRVVVMRGGSIVAVAQHDELMQTCAYYAEMYRSQAAWYD